MIPKIIHYCWFGGNPKPQKVLECIETWKKYLPDFKIMEWNESNFDYRKIKYTREAYAVKKYAFVSDVARLYALYEFGGVYFDTDICAVKKIDKAQNATFISISIIEGRNHIVKRLFESIGLLVDKLTRTHYDFLDLGNLKSGEYRTLSIKEVKKLYRN